jgi:hypothetical protein
LDEGGESHRIAIINEYMSTYLSPEEILNNPEYIRMEAKSDGYGGSIMTHITHHTRVPSLDPRYPSSDGWESIIYFRYIGSHNTDESRKNGLGGYVYVLVNRQYPNMCKIGMTTNHPEKRLQQINNAGVVVDWELVYWYKCARPYDFEQALHSKLSYCRHRNDREFFDLPSGEVVRLIEDMGNIFSPI